MALTKETFSLGINDLKLYPITADTASAYTIGTGVDVPGVQSITFEITIDEKELKGDETIQDIWSKAQSVKVDFSSAKMSLDVLKSLLGGTITSSGTTPSQSQTWSYDLGVINAYVQVAAKIDYVDTLANLEDLHIHFMKCKLSSTSGGSGTEEYATNEFSCKGINTQYAFTAPKGKAITVSMNETAASLSGIAST